MLDWNDFRVKIILDEGKRDVYVGRREEEEGKEAGRGGGGGVCLGACLLGTGGFFSLRVWDWVRSWG